LVLRLLQSESGCNLFFFSASFLLSLGVQRAPLQLFFSILHFGANHSTGSKTFSTRNPQTHLCARNSPSLSFRCHLTLSPVLGLFLPFRRFFPATPLAVFFFVRSSVNLPLPFLQDYHGAIRFFSRRSPPMLSPPHPPAPF